MRGGHAQGELLAQLRPSVTTPVILFTATLRTEITLIIACIDSNGPSSTTVSVYHDVGGLVFDDTNIIVRQTRSALTQGSNVFQANHAGSGIHLAPGDSIGVAAGEADDVTFSLYGITESIAEYKE